MRAMRFDTADLSVLGAKYHQVLAEDAHLFGKILQVL